jgi:orotate phosphoribosyltransferase
VFNRNKFNKFVLDNYVVGFFKQPITLKSGRESHWYVNWRNVTEDVYLTDKLTDYVLAFVGHNKLKPDCFYGVPEGATKLAVITQYKYAREQKDYEPNAYKLPMGRGRPKEHGDPKDRYFLGMPEGNTIVIEDVTTTGGSLISAIRTLKNAGVKVIAAIGLTNRMEKRDDGKSVEEAVAELGVRYYAMSDATELLPLVYEQLKPGEEIGRKVEEYFKKYGTKEVVL